jgi:hypothetical protein
MIDPKISEAYGSMLIEDDRETCTNGVERLWTLLISPRSEASASYRLAVQYALARLVVRGTTDAEIRKCQTAVS